jgi:hypothetical protein
MRAVRACGSVRLKPDAARTRDLRRTFATIGELLRHARRGVTAKHYIRRPHAALVAAADTVSARIAALLDTEETAAVIPLPVRQA